MQMKRLVSAGGKADMTPKFCCRVVVTDVAGSRSSLLAGLLLNGSAIEAGMRYDEPPTLFAPSEHLLSAALLRHDRPEAALQAAQRCLTRFLEDSWCLLALSRAHLALVSDRRDSLLFLVM
jgi:hypothetical protein